MARNPSRGEHKAGRDRGRWRADHLDDPQAAPDDHLVVASRAIALEIERDVREAEALARFDDCVAQIERPRQLFAGHLDPRERWLLGSPLRRGWGRPYVAPAHSHLPQAQAPNFGLEPAALREPLARHRRAAG